MELKPSAPRSLRYCAAPFNRTIWNWNEAMRTGRLGMRSLLIELYGIETRNILCSIFSPSLLIELYGIETIYFRKFMRWQKKLLIELYGIETWTTRLSSKSSVLLIELYGIETEKLHCLDYWLYVWICIYAWGYPQDGQAAKGWGDRSGLGRVKWFFLLKIGS